MDPVVEGVEVDHITLSTTFDNTAQQPQSSTAMNLSKNTVEHFRCVKSAKITVEINRDSSRAENTLNCLLALRIFNLNFYVPFVRRTREFTLARNRLHQVTFKSHFSQTWQSI